MEKQPDFNSQVTRRVDTDQKYNEQIEGIKDNIFTIGTIEAILETYVNDVDIPVSDKVFDYQALLPKKIEELDGNVQSAIEHIKNLVGEEIELLSEED